MDNSIKKKLEEFYENQLGYVDSNGKKLRRGITTGTVATAVSKAGALYFLEQKELKSIELTLHDNKNIQVLLERYEIKKDGVTVYSRKYAGDDIDATNLALIYAKVNKRNDKNINITGGKGVGIVTRKGLDANIGQSAINSKPKENIIREIKSITDMGFDIEICVENGEEIAKKTFNDRLGIIGGISIIGTTGIVEPMSVEAMKSSISKEINVKVQNSDNIVLAFGNMGEKALNLMGISSEKICICSNYIGYALEQITTYNHIKKVLIAGNFGKAVKLAGGIFNTHSHIADAKNEIIVANLALMKAPYELLNLVINSNTTRQVNEYIKEYGFEKVYDILAQKASQKCEISIKNQFKTYVLMLDYDNNKLNDLTNIDDFK
ncbi:MAG: cobalt-precorrin-5B (C(1))-methyltransferase CbiD [Peptoanaerobacter stomatis]|uniref:cobalt-precorrin-5B (C(1))-methyltransferase CbiD n=1 Tax=Peptoanaerobacter stomatis TaxID=796937 RepID=UPI003FA07C5A